MTGSVVQFAELSWMDIAKRLESDSRIVIPMGATEQHGYLSLSTDTLFAEKVTRLACANADVLVSPVIPFGCSAFAVNFPGTISLRTTTMCCLIEDIVDCLYRQGFRRLVFVTAHGGNEVITGSLSEVQLDRPNLAVYYRSAGAGMSRRVGLIEQERGLPATEHAAWNEAFDFTRVGDIPQGKKEFPSTPDFPMFPLNPRLARHYMGDGVQSGEYAIDDRDMMQSLFSDCVQALSSFLSSLPKTPPER